MDAARDTGRAFEQALTVPDYDAACGLLAPATREQLEQDEERACPEALAAVRLPVARTLHATEVYGRQAMMRADDETLFLSQFSRGWRVVAAGCRPREGKPYQCVVKGG
ncbi:hypothetical protein ABZO31_31520 [Streptomyces sp. HUAS MG47]|uniref:hypothetical protein n=1 Tax=Streptomyces solicamelliae TaxID=3231716 RepID=UPI003877B3DC